MILKTKETSKRPIKIALWCFLLFMFTSLAPMGIHAESDLISVSGSFLGNAYHLAAGSQLDAMDSFIEVKNNSNEVVMFSLSAKVQNGLALVFQQGSLSLSANSTLRIPIGIVVDQTMPAGDYPLTLELTYTASSQAKTVIVLASSLKVDAITSDVTIHVVSNDQKPVEAILHLSQMVNGDAMGLRSVQATSLNERLPYGDYRLLVDGSGYQKMFFFTVDSPAQTKDYIFETIMIPSVSVTSQLDPKTKKATAFDVVYVIDNLISEKNNIKIDLSVYDQSTLIDLMDIAYLPTLSISKLQSTYRYIPKSPLNGNLTFKVTVSDLAGTVLGNQVSQNLDLRDKTWMNLINWLGFAVVFTGLGTGLFYGLKKLKSRQTHLGKPILSPLLSSVSSVDPSLILEKTSTPRNQIQPVLKPVILPVSSEEFSVFGIGFTLTGDVSSESSLIIKGKVIGNLVSTQRIIIESGAEVTGNVTAQDIRICGSVNGIITVHQELSIEHSAKVVGSIHTTTLSVEKGAVLDCQISDH